MKKKQGILVLILTVIVVGFLAFTTAVGFGPAGIGAAKNIKTGLDLAGGVSITYQVKGDAPSQEDIQMYQFVTENSGKTRLIPLEATKYGFVVPTFNNALEKIVEEVYAFQED